MPKSVYIHIPFCKSKCKYCSFISFTQSEKKSDYIKALLQEISTSYQGEKLKTLYFGGGTPSLIDSQSIAEIISRFRLDSDCEITLEINPDDANEEYLKSIKDAGVNRLSIGSQTFNDNVLKLIGRRHTAQDTINTIHSAKKVGFDNISIDLIYGLPTITKIRNDLNVIANLDIQHISTYGLKIDEGSYFFDNPPQMLPDEDLQADMYLEINAFLEARGFKRYEISNFAKKGFESRHNLNYWNNDEYYGFGIAAHGYINGIRYSKICSIEEYLINPLKQDFSHITTTQEKLEEEIFLGFRKESGINTNKINDRFNINFDKKFKQVLEKYQPEYIEKTRDGYKLTLDGILLSNIILADFI